MLGYRFSVVDKNGNTKNGKVIDVYRNTSYANQGFNWYKFSTKCNKKQLKDNQNGGFSTSKTTTNCYKEADMGFAQSLPVTSGMSSWQNDTRNLNPILSKLGIGGISNLKNGDKVLVEPIYDVRLESVWHSLTVTEIALYGKHILGANSDGGASKTSESWGFISNYTNKHFPNALYTPDGQGLWTGVGALSKRATFYTIINSGYGVGIAYRRTTPFVYYNTPDTTYEREAPSGFTKPNEPESTKAYTTWWEYKYEDSAFKKVNYGIGIYQGFKKETTPATGATATQNGSNWTMKSGYGISVMDCSIMTSVTNYETPSYGTGFTVPQYAYSLFPEYNCQNASGKITTMKTKVENYMSHWVFPKIGDVDNVHYTPVWYPDGKYSVVIVQSDAWTPMGMLSCKDVISNITLSGNMYDDWYIGRK